MRYKALPLAVRSARRETPPPPLKPTATRARAITVLLTAAAVMAPVAFWDSAQTIGMPTGAAAQGNNGQGVELQGGAGGNRPSEPPGQQRKNATPSATPTPSTTPSATPPPVVVTPSASPTPSATPSPTAVLTTPTPMPTMSPASIVPSPSAGGVHVYPGQNFQPKLDAALPGTVFWLHAGTYPSFDMRAGLTAQAAGDGEVVVTGGTASWDAGIWVKDAPNVTIRGLTVRGNTLGIYLRNSPGATVENNLVTDNAFGLEIHATTTGTVIRGNRIVENDRFLDSSRKAGGMNLMDTTGGITVVGNSILGNDAVGIEVYGMDDAVIDSNVIGGSADAIETGTRSGGDCKNNLIVRNTIYQTNAKAEERGVWLRCMSKSIVAHNVIDSMDKFGIGVVGSGNFSGPVDNLTIVNNVIVNGRGFWLGTDLPSSVIIDYNDVLPCSSGTCESFGNQFAAVGSTVYRDLSSFKAGTRFMDHGLSVVPMFVNSAARDYRLRDGSPLIDRGVGVGLPFSGAGPDIGRHER